MISTAIWLFLAVAIIAANLPWLGERFFLFFSPPGRRGKRVWMRLLEWLLLYLLLGVAVLGLETKVSGMRHAQDWEFYAITFCLFIIFAVPGFIYHYQWRHLLDTHRN